MKEKNCCLKTKKKGKKKKRRKRHRQVFRCLQLHISTLFGTLVYSIYYRVYPTNKLRTKHCSGRKITLLHFANAYVDVKVNKCSMIETLKLQIANRSMCIAKEQFISFENCSTIFLNHKILYSKEKKNEFLFFAT